MKRKALSLILTAALMFGCVAAGGAISTQQASARTSVVKTNGEMRGMWFAFCDFYKLGLYNKNKATFTKNLGKALDSAKANGCNVIFWHARAFDDATWSSKTFKASKYLTSKASGKKTAAKTYGYDPMKIVTSECHKRGLEVHAWLNPYRVTYSKFLNPRSKRSTLRLKRAVKELQSYDLDGIHFDDYFYHSTSKYVWPSKATKYKVTVKGKTGKGAKKAKNRRKYVNKMVRAIYTQTHKKSGWVFGISPAGNYGNCMADGADVKKWLSNKNYIDYLVPQIYWTDNWGSSGTTKMFTNRLDQFSKLNKYPSSNKMYIGLAIYNAGKSYKATGDKGWSKRNTNIKNQVKKLRGNTYKARGVHGYVLFEASDLYRSGAKKELSNLKSYLGL